MVVDGRAEFVGSDASAARKAIERTLTAPHGVMKLTLADDGARALHVSVAMADLPHPARGDRADIIVLITESGLTTAVKRGENHGKVLGHAPVVRYLATIGRPKATVDRSAGASLSADWQRDRLAVVAFVQEARPDLASASVPLKTALQ